MVVEKDCLEEHYLSEDFFPKMPENYSRRHFRVKTIEGVWKKIPRKIRSAKELQKWINKLKGADIYYSSSEWSNPEKISSREDLLTKPVSDNYLISSDLVFDIDAEGTICLETLEEARKVTINVFEAMKEFPRYSFEYLAFSGYKGFRIAYTDKQSLTEDPKLRVPKLELQRILLLEELKQLIALERISINKKFFDVKTIIDEKITTNPLGVIRVLNTGHSTTKFISTEINNSLLKKNISEILIQIPHLGKETPRIPTLREMTQETEVAEPRSRLSLTRVDASGVASTHPSFFYSNNIIGLKNCYIPIITYQRGVKYIKEITDLQKKHFLGDLYIVEDSNKIHVVSLKVMQFNQLKKLLSKTKCLNKNSFKKYKVSRIPLGCEVKKIIKGDLKGSVSKAHSKLFDNYKGVLSGADELLITMAGNPVEKTNV